MKTAGMGRGGEGGEVGRDENLTMGAGDKVGGRQRSYSHKVGEGSRAGRGVTKNLSWGMVFEPSGGGKTGLPGEDQDGKSFSWAAFSGEKYDFWRKLTKNDRGEVIPPHPAHPLAHLWLQLFAPLQSRSAEIVTRRPDSAAAAV